MKGSNPRVRRAFMFEMLERLILLQIGAAAATRERVQEAVDRLIEQGRMEREEGRMVVEDVVSRARERSVGARSLVDASVQQGLRESRPGIPTRTSSSGSSSWSIGSAC
jgi:polyhydroxyalkanoate synthesis regulator phasin